MKSQTAPHKCPEPGCGSAAYDSGFSVECTNKDCRHFHEATAEAHAGETQKAFVLNVSGPSWHFQLPDDLDEDGTVECIVPTLADGSVLRYRNGMFVPADAPEQDVAEEEEKANGATNPLDLAVSGSGEIHWDGSAGGGWMSEEERLNKLIQKKIEERFGVKSD